VNKKGIIIFSSVTIIVIILGITFYSLLIEHLHKTPQITQNEKTEVLKENIQTSKDPYVLAIRKELNLYLTDKLTAKSDPLLVNGDAKLDRKGFLLTGLKNFNKEYYKSKFIAFKTMSTHDSGKIIYLEFIDKPNKVFTAGVYPNSNGSYELVYFGQNQQVTQDRIQELNAQYSFLLQDKTHAL
jgi:hypothetical protein